MRVGSLDGTYLHRVVFAFAATTALSFVSACSKPATQHGATAHQPPPETIGESSSSAIPALARTESAPAQPPFVIAQPEPSPDARTLEQRYFAATNATDRAEIAGQLCDLNTPEAAATARRLFSTERDEDTKLALLTDLAEMESPVEREQNFNVFVSALFPTQPRIIREVAISLLTDYSSDARALQLLRNLSNDPDAEIREAAADAVRALQKTD